MKIRKWCVVKTKVRGCRARRRMVRGRGLGEKGVLRDCSCKQVPIKQHTRSSCIACERETLNISCNIPLGQIAV